MLGQVIRTCMENVDKFHPYFFWIGRKLYINLQRYTAPCHRPNENRVAKQICLQSAGHPKRLYRKLVLVSKPVSGYANDLRTRPRFELDEKIEKVG